MNAGKYGNPNVTKLSNSNLASLKVQGQTTKNLKSAKGRKPNSYIGCKCQKPIYQVQKVENQIYQVQNVKGQEHNIASATGQRSKREVKV